MKKIPQILVSSVEVPENYDGVVAGTFGLVTLIYFANAAYEYWVIQPEEISGIIMSISLGILFLVIGLMPYMQRKK